MTLTTPTQHNPNTSQQAFANTRQSVSMTNRTRPRVPKRNVRRKWASIKHVNGVAVYLEEPGEDGTGGAVMASLVVRAPPNEVFEVRECHVRGVCGWLGVGVE